MSNKDDIFDSEKESEENAEKKQPDAMQFSVESGVEQDQDAAPSVEGLADLYAGLAPEIRETFVSAEYQQDKDGRDYLELKNKTGLVIKDFGTEIKTDRNPSQDEAEAIVAAAMARGWESLSLKGSPEFKRAVWERAAQAGLPVVNYEPSPEEKAKMDLPEEAKTAAPENKIEKDTGQEASPNKIEKLEPEAEDMLRAFDKNKEGTKKVHEAGPNKEKKDPRPWKTFVRRAQKAAVLSAGIVVIATSCMDKTPAQNQENMGDLDSKNKIEHVVQANNIDLGDKTYDAGNDLTGPPDGNDRNDGDRDNDTRLKKNGNDRNATEEERQKAWDRYSVGGKTVSDYSNDGNDGNDNQQKNGTRSYASGNESVDEDGKQTRNKRSGEVFHKTGEIIQTGKTVMNEADNVAEAFGFDLGDTRDANKKMNDAGRAAEDLGDVMDAKGAKNKAYEAKDAIEKLNRISGGNLDGVEKGAKVGTRAMSDVEAIKDADTGKEKVVRTARFLQHLGKALSK